MDDQLHAARFVEETLKHECLLRRDDAQSYISSQEVFGQLASGGIRQLIFDYKPVSHLVGCRAIRIAGLSNLAF